jgi:uncharacterized protein YjiS (DUF1127 family)
MGDAPRLALTDDPKGKIMFASLHTASLATRRVQSVGSAARLWAALTAMLATRRQRLNLASLDDRALADIGLSREDVRAEIGRPFWDIAGPAIGPGNGLRWH